AELESLRVEMDRQAERLRAEREEFQKEKEQVNAGRSSIDHDLASVRMDRERVGTEEKRVQDWARTLNERQKAKKENEISVKWLDLELSSHLKDSEGKIQSLMEREEMSAQRERALAETIERLVGMERGVGARDEKVGKGEVELITLTG